MAASRLGIVARRVGGAIPSLVGVVVVTFVLTRSLPGDPAVYFAGLMADAESIAATRARLGLDRTWIEQFVSYVERLFAGDWGVSLQTGRPVLTELSQRLPASLELTLAGLLFAIGVAVPLGVLAATRPNSWVDHLCRVVVTAGVSLPTFFTGLFLVYLFYFLAGVAPSPLGRLDFIYFSPPHVTGFYTIDTALAGDWWTFRGALAQLVLPALTLGLFALAPIARMTRASMLAALSADFVRTATAMGLSRRKVLWTYAFGNAFLPVLTTLGMVFSFLLGANVLVERVFSWPGVGSFAIDALVASDYAAVQGFVLAMALLFVAVNLLIDVIYTLVDPRVGLEG
ncbi:MAG: ABC transporter permease [Rhodobacteraceae bacterium]|nr:MAG: ABC transporter permease [Paracoccaceae bacterium]